MVGLVGLFRLPWPIALFAVALYMITIVLFATALLIVAPFVLLVEDPTQVVNG